MWAFAEAGVEWLGGDGTDHGVRSRKTIREWNDRDVTGAILDQAGLSTRLTQLAAYEAVRYAWKIDPRKAGKTDYVLAAHRGLIVGAFVAGEWLQATPGNFPGTTVPREGRWGFVGKEAPDDIQNLYVRKRIPEELRKKGAANPVRYVWNPDKER